MLSKHLSPAHCELPVVGVPLAKQLSGEPLFFGELFFRGGHRYGGDPVEVVSVTIGANTSRCSQP
jgi:hypothetical protein